MNIAARLVEQAREQPDKAAIVEWTGSRRHAVSYAELQGRAARIAGALADVGVLPGQKVLLLLPLSIALYEHLLGVLHLGATAVFVDPGAGFARMDRAVAAARPDARIGGWKTRFLPLVVPALARVARSLGPIQGGRPVPAAVIEPAAPALITFTTGSTGAPKASARSHAFLATQHDVLARHLGTQRADVDLTTLPVFVLHDLAAGATSVLAGVDPRRLREVLVRERVTTMVASPAIAQRLAASGEAKLPLRALFTGGAPVLPALARLLVERVSGEVFILYGSTEAEPIARISGRAFLDALAEPGALGLCAGPPVEELELALLRPTDGPLTMLERVAAGEVGEVAVAGAHVATGYFEDPAADARNKVKDGARTWHRTGDAARLDPSGRLWLMGRVGQRIERDGRTWWPLPAELRALTLAGVRHAAWFGDGSRAVLCVECADRTGPALAEARAALAPIPLDTLYVLDAIPRDPRHHSKTDLESLRRKLRRVSPRG